MFKNSVSILVTPEATCLFSGKSSFDLLVSFTGTYILKWITDVWSRGKSNASNIDIDFSTVDVLHYSRDKI